MGWWRAGKNGESLLLEGDKDVIGMVGDEVADIMDTALGKIYRAYRREWKRDPTQAELDSLWKFCRRT